MSHYTLRITHNNQVQNISLVSGEPITLEAQPETIYQLFDAQGNPVTPPQTQIVGEDLWVYTGEQAGQTPELILKNYQNHFLTADSGHIGIDGVFAQTASEQLLAAEVGIASSAPMSLAAAGAIGLATVGGVALAASAGNGSSSATDPVTPT
ncbi:MAG: hypothetical protein Q4C79_03000, partial [Neisseria sp.]|uniref:hypothetical protein n=1 Tax=Neisseria sp. TaxID=192066 RepID=UPI0026DC8BE7